MEARRSSSAVFHRLEGELVTPQGGYVYVERRRPLLPGGPGLFDQTRRIAVALEHQDGYSFGGAVLDATHRHITPAWLDVGAYAPAGSGTCFAATAALSHTAFGMSGALDLGARDGSNASGWGINDHDKRPEGLLWMSRRLYVGDHARGIIRPVASTPRITSLDASSQVVVMYEFWGSQTYSVSVAPVEGAPRRFICSDMHRSKGYGELRLSPDGEWALVGSRLFELATGASVEIPELFALTGPFDWAPRYGASTIVCLDQSAMLDGTNGPLQLVAFDLATRIIEPLGDMRTSQGPELPPRLRGISGLAVSPDGAAALCGSKLGLADDLPNVIIAQDRVSMLNLETRELEVLVDPLIHVEGVAVEREHSAFRWLGAGVGGPVSVHPQLLAAMTPAADGLGREHEEQVASDARDVAILALNAMIDGVASANPGLLLPEAVAAIETVVAFDPDTHIDVLRWVDGVSTNAAGMAFAGELPENVAAVWTEFNEEWERIKGAR